MRFALASAALALGLAAAPAAIAATSDSQLAQAAGVSARLDQALAGAHRSAENKARDAFRNPKATLEFFGLEPGMTVIEISPGGGWYTEVLAPVLREEGRLIIATGLNGQARTGLVNTFNRFAANPAVYDKVQVVGYDVRGNQPLVAPGSADMVLVVRHMHGLFGQGTQAQALKLYFDALKPGGVLGVIAHRWPADQAKPTKEEMDKLPYKMNGYLSEAEVIAAAEAAGFTLAARSDINANPKDTRNHPSGVWSLPPNFMNVSEADQPRFAQIGESDRMTLKFVKP
jgi:predicted methyltransferase